MSSDAPITVAFFVSVASIVWSAAYAWTRWLVRPHQEPDLITRSHQFQMEQRLADIERVMHGIAAEVERLAEVQRVTSAQLSERLSQAGHALRSPGEVRRVDTPH